MRSSSKPAPDPSNDKTRQQQHQRRQNREAEHDCEVGGKIIKPFLLFLVGVSPRLFGGLFLVRQANPTSSRHSICSSDRDGPHFLSASCSASAKVGGSSGSRKVRTTSTMAAPQTNRERDPQPVEAPTPIALSHHTSHERYHHLRNRGRFLPASGPNLGFGTTLGARHQCQGQSLAHQLHQQARPLQGFHPLRSIRNAGCSLPNHPCNFAPPARPRVPSPRCRTTPV